MLSLAVLFAAITIVIEVHSIPVQELDLENILELAKAQGKKKYAENRDENISNYGSLKSQELVELMQKATEDNLFKNEQSEKGEYRDAAEILKELNNIQNLKKNDKVTFGHYYDHGKDLDKNTLENDNDNDFNNNDDRYKHSVYNDQALEQLLSQNVLDKNYHSVLEPKSVPNRLGGSYELNNERIENSNNKQDGYSKIYIILNPEAMEKSGNKKNLNSLLSKILSLTSSQAREKEKLDRTLRYKGFPVKTFSRRAVRRDSRELYGKDSLEGDYKPKRGRSERGGGVGGGAGGRTAIPYIRNRGDIYERDH